MSTQSFSVRTFRDAGVVLFVVVVIQQVRREADRRRDQEDFASTRGLSVIQGPIIQPKLVGQARTSDGRTSRWRYASAALLIGVVWVHGIPFGSFVVPDENKMFVGSPG